MGNVYMKAQLSVKRELSKAKAPVMAHFGAAVEGISESPPISIPPSTNPHCINTVAEPTPMDSVHPCVRRTGGRADQVDGQDRRLYPCEQGVQ